MPSFPQPCSSPGQYSGAAEGISASDAAAVMGVLIGTVIAPLGSHSRRIRSFARESGSASTFSAYAGNLLGAARDFSAIPQGWVLGASVGAAPAPELALAMALWRKPRRRRLDFD